MSHIKDEASSFEEELYANALLVECDGYATSERVKNNMLKMIQKSSSARESALKRWRKNEDCIDKTQNMRTHSDRTCERNANKVNKIKVNKIKEKNIYIPPKFEEFWALYPSRNGKKLLKQAALKRFLLLEAEWDIILIAAKNYASSKQVRDGFAKDGVRFLKDSYWKEWLEPEEKTEDEKLAELKERLKQPARIV
jgi:hypothetical protein